MKIRLISDVHVDVNSKYGVNLNIQRKNTMFTLVAGDISGHPDLTIDWVRKNMTRGAFISGNHDVYNKEHIPLEDIKEKLHENFPVDGPITYLDSDVGVISKDLPDGSLLVGDVLYTDYSLPTEMNPTGDVGKNIWAAVPKMSGGGMNDFHWGRVRTGRGKVNEWANLPKGIMFLTPDWYLDHFNRTWPKIEKVVEDNKDRNIILMTHHCLSQKCISEDYVYSSMNASYVTDKEDWILAHPNIRCILSGHVHTRRIFNIGNTVYVLNPLGYCNTQLRMYDEKLKRYEMWSKNCILDTKTWTVSHTPCRYQRWLRIHNKEISNLMKLAPFIF